MCQVRYEIWRTDIDRWDSDETEEAAYIGSESCLSWRSGKSDEEIRKSGEEGKMGARERAIEWSKANPGVRVSVEGWDCGGPFDDNYYFVNGVEEPQWPAVKKRRDRLTRHRVGWLDKQQKKDLLQTIEDIIEDPTTAEWRAKVAKAKVEKELDGYSVIPREEYNSMKAELSSSREAIDGMKEFLQLVHDNAEDLANFKDQLRDQIEQWQDV